ncbi:MAG: alanyl-tRNA editing protein [Oscillospiraceae bacterium]|nr:alanyl-tRNA editing protein [Oscillospiraceae bacterium]
MRTILLYRQDVCRTEFTAQVLSCEEYKGRYAVELDQTCFYPEGGGQPADRGVLDGQAVLHVKEDAERVLHLVEKPVEAGKTVEGKIDWDFRFCQMQHHTGEHIVSGIAHRLFGADNVGFHMGEELVTIDLTVELTAEQVREVEYLANAVVQKNIPVEESFPDADALKALDYRSKKELEGQVRIITVPSADCCACCGTHVVTTGQVGMIKLLQPQKYKGGVRITVLCGQRALADYNAKDQSVMDISHQLSAPPAGVAQAVRQQAAQLEELKLKLAETQDKLFGYMVEGLAPEGTICLFEEGLAPNDLRRLAAMMGERRNGISAVFCSAEDGSHRYAVCCHGTDLRPLCKAWNQALNGRGGGDKALVQGSVRADRKAIEDYFAAL